jgi:UDP-N-acetylglucosamine diphosphorylase/glucosamine-1-phosphate N-acetyltransferase
MHYLLYEDRHCDNLSPIALLRPAFELICGRESLRRRLERWFPGAHTGAWIRPWLQDVYREEFPAAHVNDLVWLQQSRTLIVNGRWIPETPLALSEVTSDNAGCIDGNLAWIVLEPEESRLLTADNFDSMLLQLAGMRRIVQASGQLIRYPWDLVNLNARQLTFDFADTGISERPQGEHVVLLGDPADAWISPEAEIDPFVVIDCRTGPVSIERHVHIQSFTRIEGPCHIASGSRLFRALIRGGTTIGNHCRVGGEIEASILHGCVNKYHEGFLGHSYVCPWVNLGAMTSTSDLKNDYSNIRVPLQGDLIETQSPKVGSFIGDHTKTAIDSMFNTGSSIGVMAMVLPGGRLLPRHIPSFCNLSFGELVADWPLEDSLLTARAVMARRGKMLTPAAERLIRTVHQQTEPERQRALERAMQKRMQT